MVFLSLLFFCSLFSLTHKSKLLGIYPKKNVIKLFCIKINYIFISKSERMGTAGVSRVGVSRMTPDYRISSHKHLSPGWFGAGCSDTSVIPILRKLEAGDLGVAEQPAI